MDVWFVSATGAMQSLGTSMRSTIDFNRDINVISRRPMLTTTDGFVLRIDTEQEAKDVDWLSICHTFGGMNAAYVTCTDNFNTMFIKESWLRLAPADYIICRAVDVSTMLSSRWNRQFLYVPIISKFRSISFTKDDIKEVFKSIRKIRHYIQQHDDSIKECDEQSDMIDRAHNIMENVNYENSSSGSCTDFG